MKILIANRGEIARRIIRTAHRLGHQTVAVYGDPDRNAAHVAEASEAVRLGPAALSESYLDPERLLAAIESTGADAVHPGYGFLAENAAFARAVIAAGARWIGPHPDAIAHMGSKIEARRIALEAGVPIIPGYDESQDPADLAAAAERIGFPVLVKAAAGGGGKGIRIVHEASAFQAALAEASAEAERNFGDGAMIVERYIQRPRHVEVQIIGDQHGNLVHLGTRECSVQRRYQKVLEEAPAPNLPATTRAGLHAAALTLGAAMLYDSAGTVEFIVDDATGDFFFLETNTRLQVEHPVTEEVTGLDIVELMIGSAAGEQLPITQGDVIFSGHAIECRINAENPADGFSPDIGRITELTAGRFDPDPSSPLFGKMPTGRFRWDAAVREGDEVTPFYDSMIAKLIVWNTDRDAALDLLRGHLDGLRIDGVCTTAEFHRWLVDQPPIVEGRVTTRFLDETDVPADAERAASAAASAWRKAEHTQYVESPFHALSAFRVTPHRPSLPVILRSSDRRLHHVPDPGSASGSASAVPTVEVGWTSAAPSPDAWGGGVRPIATRVAVDARTVRVVVDGYPHRFSVPTRAEAWAPGERRSGSTDDAISAPFPGTVTSVGVAVGDTVAAGTTCVVIEAMKMLHSLTAPTDAVVAAVEVSAGDQVASHQVLVTFASADAGDDPDTAAAS